MPQQRDQPLPDNARSRLDDLERQLPRLGATLRRADRLRAQRVAELAAGARFRGLNELLEHLDDIVEQFQCDQSLRRLAFLVERSVGDFEIAIESALSGYLSVAADAMRDVMEVENLLLDFAVDPSRIDEWLAADGRALRTKYRPAAVRDRLHRAGEGAYASSAEAPDYRAHSEALHVRPGRHPVAPRGFSADAGWNGDAAYWEIFEHHRRLRLAIGRLSSSVSPGSSADHYAHSPLTHVEDARKRTREMQTLYVELLSATTTVNERSAK